MNNLDLMRELAIEGKTKILLLVLDGVGGLPLTPEGPTELEAALPQTWMRWRLALSVG